MSGVKEAAERGHEAARKAAAALGREWQDEAVAAIRAFAETHEAFAAEDVRAAFPKLDKIAERRAWGSAFIAARDEWIVEPRGVVRVASSRGSFKTLWRSRVFVTPEDAAEAGDDPLPPFPPNFLKPKTKGVRLDKAH